METEYFLTFACQSCTIVKITLTFQFNGGENCSRNKLYLLLLTFSRSNDKICKQHFLETILKCLINLIQSEVKRF